MNEKTKITLLLGGITLLVIGAVSASFAFLSVSKKQDIANTFTSGCLNISIENESNAITLNNTYPITDLEGLGTEGYTFTIKNTCGTSSNYQINLESLNQTTNTLDTQYIKTSLSSDTMDNLVWNLNDSLITKTYIENAYVSHNLYKGTINGNSTKEFNLKLWIDYDTTKEQGANKTYTSKINVIANPDIEVTTESEIKTTLVDNNVEGTINGSVNDVKYCISKDNICIPNTNTEITDNKVNVDISDEKEIVETLIGNLEVNIADKKIVCASLDDKTTYCSDLIDPKIPDFSKAATTDEGIYRTNDGMYGGYSYYWRGASTTNHVIFADKCWRIVRINGDKTMRLIYNGPVKEANTCAGNGSNSESVVLGATLAEQYYSTSDGKYDNTAYVGWTYDLQSQRTLSGTPSNAKTLSEKWYNENITGTNASKVVNGKFCNDRDVGLPFSGWNGEFSPTWSAAGTQFAHAAVDRVWNKFQPTLACPSGDVYELKVGAIMVDETEFAGGNKESNTSYYLYNGQTYWTMSPTAWNPWDGNVDVFVINSSGSSDNWSVGSTSAGLRPVINLKSDTEFQTGGSGTQSNPYVVK